MKKARKCFRWYPWGNRFFVQAVVTCYNELASKNFNRENVFMKLKNVSVVLLAVVLVFSLCACGGAKIDPDDPNQGLWKAMTGEMFGMSTDVEDIFGEGFTIELQSNGKCTLNVDGKKANGTWTLNNGAFTVKGGGIDCKGRLENGKLTLEDVLDMGLNLVFEKEGGYSGVTDELSAADDSNENSNENSNELSAADDSNKNSNEKLAWWDGDWFGYWTVVSADDPYLSLKGGVWDCYVTIDTREDGTATVTWWDDDMPLGDVEIAISFDGYQVEIGLADSTGGTLFGDTVKDGDWYIKPDESEYENMLQIDAWYEDSDGESFRYNVFLLPWGMLWNDVPEDERPPSYDSWYLDVRNMTMAEVLGGETPDQAPDQASDETSESGGGAATDITYELVGYTLSLTLPSSDWIDMGITGGSSGGVTTAHFYYIEDHANAPRVDITETFTMSSFDTYKNYWSDYADIASKTIGGIEMEGRTYISFGMEYIEYIGKISEEQYVGVTIIKLDPESGETKALLDSITFS